MPPTHPFYVDWTFWAVIVALLAVLLSQLPPVHILLRPKRLEVEVHSRLQVTHQVGNPNVGLYVNIANTGGRELRVRRVQVDVSRDGKYLGALPAQNYFETPSSQSSVLFVPFSLKPGEHWGHAVNFLSFFDRQTEKLYRQNQSALDADIRRKLDARPKGDEQIVVAEQSLVAPFTALFDRLFIWEPGEYVFALSVNADPGSASYTKKYRFTLYESDTLALRKNAEDYQYGGGISYNVPRHVGVFVPLAEHVG
ncbi:hypothetical protein ACFOFO_09730 [Undibacterium arcticum]|uniref:Uncharacterized protein n=1 Tax=Undibacterium arcticum TaxID=1762892 RepID=A0ABV7F2B3_9BURK